MAYIKIPNLPTEAVTSVLIDGRAPQGIKDSLERLDIEVVTTLAHPDVYPAVAFHPDIMLHHIGSNIFVYAPNTPLALLEALRTKGFELLEGKTFLGNKYPGTIAYNVARVGKYAFHNTRYTDPLLKELLEAEGVELIHTNQGYTKCLTCVVDENSIITSDKDILASALKHGLDVLLIEPDEAIRLEPFNMGFIGGATGLINKNKLAVAGNLSFHKNYIKIMDFLSLKYSDVVMLNDDKLIDIGTIIPLEQTRQIKL